MSRLGTLLVDSRWGDVGSRGRCLRVDHLLDCVWEGAALWKGEATSGRNLDSEATGDELVVGELLGLGRGGGRGGCCAMKPAVTEGGGVGLGLWG